MYLPHREMMMSCPAATTMRIAAVVAVLQELPVVAACNSRATLGGDAIHAAGICPITVC